MKGFTLLELLIVIGILAILATLAILVLNPAELLRQARDTQRVNDLASVNKALSFLQVDQPEANFGTASTTYISLPDTDDANPPDCDEYSLPALPSGWSYYCALKSSHRKTDGTGWIPTNLTVLFSTGSPLSNLPIDPVNTAQNSLYYTYVAGGSWELNAMMEAQKNKLGGASDQVSKDGGDSYELYELGSNLSASPINDSGLVGYWKLAEGSGTTANDSSGNNNNGPLTNGPAWQTESNCKVDKCLSFDGADDYVGEITIAQSITKGTIILWVKPDFSPTNIPTNVGGAMRWWRLAQMSISPRANSVYNNFMWCIHAAGWDCPAVSASTVFTQGQWAQIAMTFDFSANIARYYNNAEELSSISPYSLTGGATILTSGSTVEIGLAAEVSAYWLGLIDDVRIYNRALSAAEIRVIYDATK